MPAWSMPGSHSAFLPCMRFQRVSASSSVVISACPMWSEPVTFGGGIGQTYCVRVCFGSWLASKTPSFSQKAYQRSSTSFGSYGRSRSSLMATDLVARPGLSFFGQARDLFFDDRFGELRDDFPH